MPADLSEYLRSPAETPRRQNFIEAVWLGEHGDLEDEIVAPAPRRGMQPRPAGFWRRVIARVSHVVTAAQR